MAGRETGKDYRELFAEETADWFAGALGEDRMHFSRAEDQVTDPSEVGDLWRM